MAKSPLEIILELILLIIQSTIEGIEIVFDKLVELFESLFLLANTGIAGLLISVVVGGVVVLLISRFIFGNTKTLLRVFLVYLIFIIIVFLIVNLTSSTPQTLPPS